MSVPHLGAHVADRQGNTGGTTVSLSGHLLTHSFNCNPRPWAASSDIKKLCSPAPGDALQQTHHPLFLWLQTKGTGDLLIPGWHQNKGPNSEQC